MERKLKLPRIHRHAILQLGIDTILVASAYWLTYKLRFDDSNGVPERYAELRNKTFLPTILISLCVFMVFGLYQRWWRYLGQRDYLKAIQAVVVATVLLPVYVALAQPVKRPSLVGDATVTIPTSIITFQLLLTLAFIVGLRSITRMIYERPLHGFRGRRNAKGVLIVGAGDGGRLVLREVFRNPELGLRPVGFVDDDPAKRNIRIEGVKVLGPTNALGRILDEAEPDEVMIAIPSAPGVVRAQVVQACRERNIAVRTLPTVFELLRNEQSFVGQIRSVQVEDILGREPVRMELDEIGGYLKDATVLVTGAGGSIGSELCRQITTVNPEKVILLDHAEDNLFSIQRELEQDRHVPSSNLVSVLADCKDKDRIEEIFTTLQPDVVFHAAAYKHVGLMEQNPFEAVRNNALATRIVAQAAGKTKVKIFVLVSTDKAVEPATAMGTSKALAELAVTAQQTYFPETKFSAVRFGNVLGSSGSVVPIFRNQIARGGPVTVTDKEMTRYFMTIPEAVQLILRSGALTTGKNEIFVLEMGDPVSILDLAKTMIELSGFVPEKEIAIEITGRRPGEKLHETLFNPSEHAVPTTTERIIRVEGPRRQASEIETFLEWIEEHATNGNSADLVKEFTRFATKGQPTVTQQA